MASKDQIAAFIAAEFPQTQCVILAVGEVVAHAVGTYAIPPR
jgi:flagellar motor switch protein FliG